MFSLSVKLAELNDFLAPAQDCVKSSSEGQSKPSLIKPTTATGNDEEAKSGQVNLTDCLACSGCVTSAASVLLEAQSHLELLKRITIPDASEKSSVNSKDVIIISLSSQSEAALAAVFNLSIPLLYRLLGKFLRGFGIAHVLHMNLAQAMYTAEANAWLENKRTPPTVIYGSHCPGWICYAEKVHSEDISSQLLPIPPVQMWQGLLVKTLLTDPTLTILPSPRAPKAVGSRKYCLDTLPLKRQGFAVESESREWSVETIYHVSIQPCHDKKLECIRPEFRMSVGSSESPVMLVDLVLATNQFITFLRELGIEGNNDLLLNSNHPKETKAPGYGLNFLTSRLDLMVLSAFGLPCVSKERLVRRRTADQSENCGLAGAIFGSDDQPEFVVGLNSDHLVSSRSGQSGWRSEVASGFRNIRNMMGKSSVSFRRNGKFLIEQLACPKGCLNGPGHHGLINSEGGGPLSVSEISKKFGEEAEEEVNPQVVKAIRWYLGQTMAKKGYIERGSSLLGLSIRQYILGSAAEDPSFERDNLADTFKFQFVHVRDEDHLESSQW